MEQGKLTPVTAVEEKITYHDPCFLGRHNKVYTPPGKSSTRCPAPGPRKCTGARAAGSAAAPAAPGCGWKKRIGKRINTERIEEALALNPDTISTACPYCLVMLGDAVSAKKSSGEAADTLEVIDVAQLLVRSMAPVGASVASDASAGDAGAGRTR